MTNTSRYRGPVAAALLAIVVLAAANLILGDLNQDEGWYLYASLNVANGQLPYRDFAYTQGPMLPLVYSFFAPVIHHYGVAGGRAITWTLGFAAAVLAGLTARKLGGRAAGALAFIICGLNVYQGYFTTVVKTYALCAFFIMLGFFALSLWADRRRIGWLVLSGIAFSAASGTRVSSGILLAVVGFWLLFGIRRWGRWSWLWFGLAGGISLIAIFLPLYVVAPDGFRFGLIEYHTHRNAGDLVHLLVLKAGFASRLVQAYPVAAFLAFLMVMAKLLRPFRGNNTGYHDSDAFAFVRLMWYSVAAVTLVHVSAPFPYDDYQVPVYPVLAAALAVSWAYAARAWSGEGYRWEENVEPADPAFMRWLVWSVAIISAASSFSSPINQDWMIGGRDRIWWLMKPKPSLLLLRDVARDIRARSDSNLLLTQDTYLAVEAGMNVPPGWDMGPFSYYPDMTDERARALHLVNHRMILDDIARADATVAAVSGYGLSIASPEVVPLDEARKSELESALAARYSVVKEVPMFGQANTLLRVYERKPASGTPP